MTMLKKVVFLSKLSLLPSKTHTHICIMSTIRMQGFKNNHWKIWEQLITQTLYCKVWWMGWQTDIQGQIFMPPPWLWSRDIKTVSNVIEKLVEHGIRCQTGSYTNYVINNIIKANITSHWYKSDVAAGPHSAKGLSKTFDNFVVAMVKNLWCHWCRNMAGRIKSLKLWWSLVSAMLHQIFNDFINCNFFNRNLSFSNTGNFFRHLI